MPKFYVQSGDLKLITTATNSRGAAIWAVHRTLSHALPFLRESEAVDVPSSVAVQPPAVVPQLAETISVGEQGFGRDDGASFETLDIVTEWNQLLLAVDRLQKRLAEAA